MSSSGLKVDAGFLVVKNELTQIFTHSIKVIAGNVSPEEFESKFAWIAWVLSFLTMGILLYILRLQGFIRTFYRNRAFEEEDELEEAALFTQHLLSIDRRTTAHHFMSSHPRPHLDLKKMKPFGFGFDGSLKYAGKENHQQIPPPCREKLRTRKNSDEIIFTAAARKLKETSSNYPSDFDFARLDLSSTSTSSSSTIDIGFRSSDNKKLEVYVLHDPKHD